MQSVQDLQINSKDGLPNVERVKKLDNKLVHREEL